MSSSTDQSCFGDSATTTGGSTISLTPDLLQNKNMVVQVLHLGEIFNYHVTSVSAPTLGIVNVSNVSGVGEVLPISGDSFADNTLTINFNVDRKMNNYQLAYDWLHNSRNSNDPFAFRSQVIVHMGTREFVFTESIPLTLMFNDSLSGQSTSGILSGSLSIEYLEMLFR
jgi:hypothetical protein